MELDSPQLDMMIQEIEKIRRRKIIDFSNKDDIKYIDPNDNLSTFQINNNHLILGRRGTGKTTFLLSNIKELKSNFVITKKDLLRNRDIQQSRHQHLPSVFLY